MSAKVLFLDIETAPNKVFTWGLYDQMVGLSQIIETGYMLCWGAKWLGSKQILSDSLVNYPAYFKKNPRSDLMIAKSVHKLMDEADIIIAHNGDNFDIKWLNTVFLKNEIVPPSSYKTVDTLKQAKASFRFLSNKLDHLVKSLGLGKKLEHEGFSLWVDCMKGRKRAWNKMVKYCKHDVELLERLYLELRPYMKRHPNLSLYDDTDEARCPNCNGSDLKKKGYAYTSVNKFQRYVCMSCGKNCRGKASLLSKEKGENVRRAA